MLKKEREKMTGITKIQKMYDYGANIEYKRLQKSPIHEAEFILTKDLIEEFVKPDSLVVDIGSGPGIYSEFLIEELNCNIGAVDLSIKELEIFKKRIKNKYLGKIEFVKQDSATNLNWINDNYCESILLMGPMYHLVSKDERIKVLKNCKRILKKNGIVIISYISAYGKLINTLKEGEPGINGCLSILKSGEYWLKRDGFEMQQFRCFPSQAIKEIEEESLEILKVKNLEGVGSFITDSEIDKLQNNKKLKDDWIDFLRKTSEIKDLLGSTRHFSIVAKKI